MKTCNKCKTTKELSEFFKNKNKKDGYSYHCKSCQKTAVRNYNKTKIGVISQIYSGQKLSSKRRGHNPPTYTKQELSDWLMNDWLFDLLYTNWVNCGYITDIRPSVDRLDDIKGYTFSNIQIMTWGENRAKGSADMRSGKMIVKSNPQKSVLQYSKNGEFIKVFISVSEAERMTDIAHQGISKCCNNIYKSTGGFIWKFKEVLK